MSYLMKASFMETALVVGLKNKTPLIKFPILPQQFASKLLDIFYLGYTNTSSQ